MVKRRFLIIDGSSVFKSLAIRSILRVYKNQTRDIEIHKAKDEASAILAVSTRVHPDIVISSVKLHSSQFQNEFTIYPDTPFDQDRVTAKIDYLIRLKNSNRDV